MKQFLQELSYYFAFSKQDKRGCFLLLIILSSSLIIRACLPKFYGLNSKDDLSLFQTHKDALASNNAKVEYLNQDSSRFLAAKKKGPMSSPVQNFPNNKAQYHKPRYLDKKLIIELNRADSLDFEQLYGIGSSYTKRILAYRELLGGFSNKEQLMEVWGIDSLKYQKIEGNLSLEKTNLRKLSLNKTSLYDLKKHPYLDYYQAKEIIRYRDSMSFTSINQILRISLIDKQTYRRIKPYLSL